MEFFGVHETQTYRKSLSFEIIFEARFYDMLDIVDEMPTQFQSAMRDQGYPNYRVDVSGSNAVQGVIKSDLGKAPDLFNKYIFSSADSNRPYRVILSKNSISLAHRGSYDKGVEFKNRSMRVLDSFVAIYECSGFTRIGLRHRNIANKYTTNNSELKLSNIHSFPSQSVFPELHNNKFDGLIYMDRLYVLQDNNIKVNALYSVGAVSGQYGLTQIKSEPSYIVDIDCFCEAGIVERKNVDNLYEDFENIYKNAFEWSITDELRTWIQ